MAVISKLDAFKLQMIKCITYNTAKTETKIVHYEKQILKDHLDIKPPILNNDKTKTYFYS